MAVEKSGKDILNSTPGDVDRSHQQLDRGLYTPPVLMMPEDVPDDGTQPRHKLFPPHVTSTVGTPF
jgi:hypothetical protein